MSGEARGSIEREWREEYVGLATRLDPGQCQETGLRGPPSDFPCIYSRPIELPIFCISFLVFNFLCNIIMLLVSMY